MHDGGQRSWVPACSGAAVGPAMIRRGRTFGPLRSSSSAHSPRILDATGRLPRETGDSPGHLMHGMISNREANDDPTTKVVVV
jgi:hypothetical protein